MIDKSPDQAVAATETEPSSPQSRNSPKDTIIALVFLALLLGAPVAAFFFAYDLILFLTTTRLGLLYLFTLVLVAAYSLVLTGSVLYNKRLRSEFPRKYRRHNKRITRVPRIFAGWFLPLISIFLILAGEVVFIQTATNNDNGSVAYGLIITLSRAIILIMVGMELQYTAQEHWTESRWQVLITLSLVLDFVSFFLLTAVYGPMAASTAINDVDATRSAYALLLGLASLVSSYYTVTQARLADEALANDGPFKKEAVMDRLLSRLLLPAGIAIATLVVALVGLLAFQEEMRGTREQELRHVIATLEAETARLREELERQRTVVGAPDSQQKDGCFRPLREMLERYPGRVESLQFCYSLLSRLHDHEQR